MCHGNSALNISLCVGAEFDQEVKAKERIVGLRWQDGRDMTIIVLNMQIYIPLAPIWNFPHAVFREKKPEVVQIYPSL